jgi:hypothetical protein
MIEIGYFLSSDYKFGASSEEQRAFSLRLLIVLHTSIVFSFIMESLVPYCCEALKGIQNANPLAAKDVHPSTLGYAWKQIQRLKSSLHVSILVEFLEMIASSDGEMERSKL